MILTCPSCQKRFVLPAKMLAPEGRTVKCSACEEEWFQLPDPDELIDDLEAQMDEGQDEDTQDEGDTGSEGADGAAQEADEDGEETLAEGLQEDIPEAVKPIQDKESVRRAGVDDEGTSLGKGAAIGYAAAAGVFVVIFVVFLALKSPLVSAWPPSAALYQMIGMSVDVAGEGLVFDRVQISSAPEFVTVEGLIINLKSTVQTVPLIEAGIQNSAGEVIGTWLIEAPSKTLEAEATLPFKAQYEGQAQDIESVTLRFLLKP